MTSLEEREREREREQPKFWIEGQDWKKRDQIKKWIKQNQENIWGQIKQNQDYESKDESIKKLKFNKGLKIKIKNQNIKGQN
jgi:hypothetical protein